MSSRRRRWSSTCVRRTKASFVLSSASHHLALTCLTTITVTPPSPTHRQHPSLPSLSYATAPSRSLSPSRVPPVRSLSAVVARPASMSLPHHLRAHKEASKDEVTRDFFNVAKADDPALKGMEVNCVLSIEGEAVHVRPPIAHRRTGREGRRAHPPRADPPRPLARPQPHRTSRMRLTLSLIALLSAGWSTVSPPSVSVLPLARPPLGSLYDSPLLHPTRRTAQLASRRVRARSRTLARSPSGQYPLDSLSPFNESDGMGLSSTAAEMAKLTDLVLPRRPHPLISPTDPPTHEPAPDCRALLHPP